MGPGPGGRPKYEQLTEEDKRALDERFPSTATALEGGGVGFVDLLRIHTLARVPGDAAKWSRLFDAAVEAFEARRGEIAALEFGDHQATGAVLTRTGYLFIMSPGTSSNPEVDAAMATLDQLHTRADDVLLPPEMKLFSEEIWGVVTFLLTIFDAPHGYAKLDETQAGTLTFVKQQIERIEREFPARAARAARLRYLTGTVQAVAWLAPLVAAVAGVLALAPGTNADARDLLVTFAAGAVGGTMSVLARMTNHKLEVDHEVGRRTLWLLGALRPIVGGVFGLALYALVRGLVLPVEIAAAGDDRVFSYAALAFVAGFSERYAQDAIARTAG